MILRRITGRLRGLSAEIRRRAASLELERVLDLRRRRRPDAAAGRVQGGPLPDAAARFWRGLRHQFDEARAARERSGHVLVDRRGRRLRASAHRRRRRSSRSGGDADAGSVRWVPLGALAALIVALLAAGFLGTSQVFIDLSAELPAVQQLTTSPLPNDTIIYAADGSELADLRDPQTGYQHYEVSYAHMGKWLPEATVAIEDSNFWHEPGVDPYGIVRAAVADASSGSTAQGASTITQQLVKIRLLKTYDMTYSRKVKEMILAIQVERNYPKRQILGMYLNTVDYGDFAQGAQAAAENYFRTSVANLDLAQAAMLAGIPRNPNLYSPLSDVQNAKYRQKQVLDRMVQLGEITRRQARAAYAEHLTYSFPTPEIKGSSDFVQWVVQELEQMYGTTATYEGGLHVHTSLNPTLQAIAQTSVTNGVRTDQAQGHNVQQGALVAISPNDGEIRAMVGSAFPQSPGGDINYAADVSINPGSSIKLATYAAALQSRKVSMVTPLPDGPMTISMPGFSPGYQPTNYYSDGYPPCVVQTCLGNSINIGAVYLELTAGVANVVQMARALGAPPFLPDARGNLHLINGTYSNDAPLSDYGPSLTLGGYGETPLQEADMTATVADMGLYHPATGIVEVTDPSGQALYRYNPATVARQVLSPQVAYVLADMMSNNNDRLITFGPNSPLHFPDRIVAGKTGTYDNFDSAVILGFTPSLASTMWVGNPDNSSMGFGYDTIFSAGPGWHAFMASALTAMKEPGTQWYRVPPGLISGGNGVYFVPGTSASTPAPPLPPWATIAGGSTHRGAPPKG